MKLFDFLRSRLSCVVSKLFGALLESAGLNQIDCNACWNDGFGGVVFHVFWGLKTMRMIRFN